MANSSTGLDTRLRARVLRRWYLAAGGLVATIALCVVAMSAFPKTYKAQADVLLVPAPTTTGQDANPNPYLGLGGLMPLADVLARAMSDGATSGQLKSAGLTGSYTVTRDITTNSPIVIVAATGDTDAQALQSLRLVLATAAPVLNSIQNAQSVPANSRVSAQVVATPTKATASRKTQIRALAVAAVVGLLGTALAVTVVDMLLLRRRKEAGPHTVVDLPEHADGAKNGHALNGSAARIRTTTAAMRRIAVRDTRSAATSESHR